MCIVLLVVTTESNFMRPFPSQYEEEMCKDRGGVVEVERPKQPYLPSPSCFVQAQLASESQQHTVHKDRCDILDSISVSNESRWMCFYHQYVSKEKKNDL